MPLPQIINFGWHLHQHIPATNPNKIAPHGTDG